MSTYRLSHSAETFARGALALVAGQAVELAATRGYARITDDVGRSALVSIGDHQTVQVEWDRPWQLFPPAVLTRRPPWVERLETLIEAIEVP